eukprot:GEMP01049566.1.p1 GENE.GEMP01049566.1~~GEMP01049566.1.p1  ORF type:complete len:124 (+),score=20.26 GEMP01049566.1:65-436(+)
MDKKKEENTYVVQPEYKNKFRPGPIKEIMQEVLKGKLEKATYHAEQTNILTKQVADEVKERIKELSLPRYKIVVQVVIGEQRGQGVRLGHRCFWDSSTDAFATESYCNETLFCVVTCYGVYLY